VSLKLFPDTDNRDHIQDEFDADRRR